MGKEARGNQGVADAVRPTPLNGLPDALLAKGFTGVDGDVEIFALDEVKGLDVLLFELLTNNLLVTRPGPQRVPVQVGIRGQRQTRGVATVDVSGEVEQARKRRAGQRAAGADVDVGERSQELACGTIGKRSVHLIEQVLGFDE